MSGPQLIAKQIQNLAAQAIGAKNPDLAGLMASWADIVGPEWAARCTPLTFIRGRGNQAPVLELAVSAGDSLLVQHETPVLLSRVNRYFGGPMVKSFRFRMVDPVAHPRRKVEKVLEPMVIEGVDDPELAATLGRLGAAIRESAKNR